MNFNRKNERYHCIVINEMSEEEIYKKVSFKIIK